MDSKTTHPRPLSPEDRSLSRLTVFTFLWACQALVHQEFYSDWLHENNLCGWALTCFALGSLLWPRSLLLFAAMLASSVLYNVLKWPFVVNHILLESIVNITILAAIVSTLGFARRGTGVSTAVRDQVFDRFAPVVRTMLVVMYYFAFIAKLNWDFFDPDVSCVAAMYGDLVRRIPFLPTAAWAKSSAIWLTVIVEAAIPILFTFRRSWKYAIVLGMPFHLMLGLIGHRTFSALAYALYGLFIIDSLVTWLDYKKQRFTIQVGPEQVSRLLWAARSIVVLGVIFLIAADWSGNYKAGLGPLSIYRISWAVWILWSIVLLVVFFSSMILSRRSHFIPRTDPVARPGFLWLIVAVVVLNGMSQYLGFKTETCFTMYSNLRTEGRPSNHLFMPKLRLAGYQDDLVEIQDTNHPGLLRYIEEDQYITYFELRRVISGTKSDCYVRYRRGEEDHAFTLRAGHGSDVDLSRKHPAWKAMLLYFRPVDKGKAMHCHH